MSSLSQFMDGGNLRYQEFTSSGTFTPSAKLLAKGGTVWVLLVGGGQAGENGSGSSNGRGGMGGSVLMQPFTVTGPVSVVIGAGGVGSLAAGGNSSFGSLIAYGGATNVSRVGAGGGGVSSYPPGQSGAYGFGGGGAAGNGANSVGGTCGGGASRQSAAPNSGGGGGGDNVNMTNPGAGGSGICRVWWTE